MVRPRNLGKAPVVGEGEEAERQQVVSSGPRRRQPLGRMPPLSHATNCSDMAERELTANVPIPAVPLVSARSFSPVTFREWEEPTSSDSGAVHGPHCLPEVLHESNCGLNYERLGINVKRKVIKKDPAITPTSKRAPALRANCLEIVSSSQYSKQKPWYLKRDPLFRLGPEEEILATAAAVEAGVSGSNPVTENEDSYEDELLDNLAITSRDQMIKDLDEQNSLFRIEAGKRQTGLETEIKRLKELVSSTEISLSEAQKQITLIKEQNDLKRSEFETEINNLKHTISSDNLRLMEVQKQLQTEKDHLENARELLKTRIYTQEQYNEGYENGYKVARRLAIHLEPNINWELAEEWMKTERVHLDELNPNSINFTVKVKVVEKSRQKMSSNTRATIFQTLYLQDEKNNKMRATLFGDQIKAYDEAIAYNGEYEISNATIKPMDDQYRTTNDQLPYQLHFNHRTIVQPVCIETGYVVPQYQSIASIPKLQVADERYEEAARQISSKYSAESYVREIVITDQTHNQTLTITAWNDLSGTASDAICLINYYVYKNNSYPKGDRVNMLREWVVAQKQLLQDRQARVLEIRDSAQEPSMKTIEELKEKKAANLLMEERHWIQATVPNASLDNVFVYTGCSRCGNKCKIPEGRQFTCIFCDNKNCVSAPRVAFKIEVVDVTGSMTLTSFNNDTEKMFGKTAADIKTMKDCGDVFGFQAIEEKLRKKNTFFKLGPSNSLGSSNMLEWSLKTIETSDDTFKKEERKVSVAQNAESEYTDLNDSIIIADEGERGVTNSTTLTVEPIKTPKLSTAEWTELCRSRRSGTKHSPMTPAPIGDTKSSLDYGKSTAAKKIRFTTPEKIERKSDEVAEKDPEE
uniref:Replication factor A C-terminal domain-containing protein n=1 Tax=Chenopodium quinoa TaxID=63459 RepID=A0A803M3I7_CHEQI